MEAWATVHIYSQKTVTWLLNCTMPLSCWDIWYPGWLKVKKNEKHSKGYLNTEPVLLNVKFNLSTVSATWTLLYVHAYAHYTPSPLHGSTVSFLVKGWQTTNSRENKGGLFECQNVIEKIHIDCIVLLGMDVLTY